MKLCNEDIEGKIVLEEVDDVYGPTGAMVGRGSPLTSMLLNRLPGISLQ